MEYEHEVEEDDVWNYSASSTAAVHTIDKSKASRSGNDVTVVIASENASHSRRRASPRSGMGILMMRWITEGNDDHRSSVINLNECLGGGGGDFTSNTDTLRCDSYSSSGSDNHRLKKMSQHRGDRNYHHNRCRQQQQRRSGSHPDSSSHHRQTLNRCSSRISSWVTPNNMLMLVVFTVFLLTGNVSCESFGPISSNPSSNNNQLDSEQTEPNKMGDDGTWNSGTTNNNYNARNITLNGYSVLDDINLIDTAPDYFDSYNGGGSDQDNQDWSDDPGKNREHYTHQWAVHILGGPEVARKVAEKHGFQFHGEIFPDYYHLTHARVAKRSIEPHGEYHERLALEPEVRWLKQQTVKRRFKRDFLPVPMALSGPSSSSSGGNGRSGRSRAARRSKSIVLNDPRWPAMWYLNRGEGLDMNVLEAWNDGITGKGIVVTILDDGLEKDHPDIVRNYDPMASFDVNSLDMDPMPTYDLTDSNRHGTRCAGEVAAEANNSICAVGIAFEAGVGGVRMLDGDVTDAVEARSLSHNPQHIDIYSASWGPDDDGKTVDGPGELATRAFMEGVAKGRNGKGSIFVWASGNGGRDHDNCNCDGYTNSIWTLSISSATENGLVPWYSEACSSTLATTYSSGGTGEKQIVTIDLHHSCTSSHTGTSASAPLAAGICALALQANTNLTWRDMQHIVVRTARPQNLRANDWATNGVKRNVSHSFGYGLMDAGAMVKLAKKWKTVPPQHNCEIKAPYTDKNIPSKSKVTLDLKVTNCPNVNYLEHVQAKVTLTSGRRGDLQIFLVSPSGTRSQLLAHRRHDLNRAGFTDWPFMTVHSWGESPIGKWTLEIHNEGRYTGKLQTWSLIAHGIASNPNDLVGDSGIGGERNNGGGAEGNGFEASKVGAPAAAVVDQFDGSDNTIAAESPSSSLQNSPPVPANVGVAKPVSIVGRPSSPSQSSVSSDCAKLSAQGQCLECATKSALLHGGCVSQCPQTFYVQSRGQPSLNEVSSDSSSNVHYVCLPCHYSCQTCSGPNDDECISCHEDAKLHRVSVESDPNTTTDKAHCYPTQLLDTLSRSNMSHRILLAIVAVSVVFIIFMLTFLCCDCCRRGRRVGVYKSGFEHEHDKPGWLIKKGQSQPYERIAREEIDEDDDDEFEYYDAYHSKARNLGDRRPQNKQTHLELISEDEDDDGGFEKLNTDFNRSGTVPERKGNHEQSNNSETSRLYTLHHSAGAGVHNVIPPKVPLVLPGSSRKVGESSLDCDQADKGPLV